MKIMARIEFSAKQALARYMLENLLKTLRSMFVSTKEKTIFNKI